MAYATQQDLVDRFGEDVLLQLADRDQDGVIDTAVVAEALADASETIDSYLAARYSLPLNPVPGALKRRAADMARFFLSGDDPFDAVVDANKAAIAWLKDISNGKAKLDAAGSEPAAAEGGIQVESSDRQFSRDSMKGF